MTFSIPKHILKYPTPLHIFYRNRLEEDAKTLRDSATKFLPNSRLYYSTKTNALLRLLKSMLSWNYGLEIMAPGDLKSALLAGAKAEDLLLNGVIWTKEFLSAAIFQHKIQHIHIESMDMLELLTSILHENPAPPANVSFGIRIHDGNNYFGFFPNSEALAPVAKKFQTLKIPLHGLHIHSNAEGGTQELGKICDVFKNNLTRLLDAKKIFSSLGQTSIKSMDLGGGFESPHLYRIFDDELAHHHSAKGIPTAAVAERPSLQQQSESIFSALASQLKKNNAAELKIYFEPGRSVAARSLSTLLKIHSVKNNFYPGSQLIITDGSTSLLGPLHRAIHPMSLLTEGTHTSPNTEKSFIYGLLPHNADWLAQNILLPKAKAGDHILIEHTGAYFLPLEANFGHPRPGIYDFADDILIREPENVLDLSLRDRF